MEKCIIVPKYDVIVPENKVKYQKNKQSFLTKASQLCILIATE